ncbi:MAG: hypothetical protein IPI04_16695 [Ignavibacteria bacterium]|nr:hypothetical protein [Ignavibacteria bacterium]
MLFLNTSLYSQSNWFIQNSNTSERLNSVDFVNENTGYAVGNIGVILKTTNAGVNWQINSIGLTNYLYSVDFVNINTGYAVGGNGAIIKTTNGGTNWFGQNSGTIETLNDIFLYDINTGMLLATMEKYLKQLMEELIGIVKFLLQLVIIMCSL